MKSLALLSLLIATGYAAQVTVHDYPYDDTNPVPNKVSGRHEDDREVRIAQPQIVSNYVCGAYHGRFDFTGGCALHVFPDKTALIVEFLDIAPSRVVAEGKWSINETGEVIFAWKKKSFENVRDEEFFRKTYGECAKMKLFILFNGKTPETYLLISEDMIVPEVKHAYWRTSEYLDWQTIKKDLKKGS